MIQKADALSVDGDDVEHTEGTRRARHVVAGGLEDAHGFVFVSAALGLAHWG
jgi:hypothetical protein